MQTIDPHSDGQRWNLKQHPQPPFGYGDDCRHTRGSPHGKAQTCESQMTVTLPE